MIYRSTNKMEEGLIKNSKKLWYYAALPLHTMKDATDLSVSQSQFFLVLLLILKIVISVAAVIVFFFSSKRFSGRNIIPTCRFYYKWKHSKWKSRTASEIKILLQKSFINQLLSLRFDLQFEWETRNKRKLTRKSRIIAANFLTIFE